MGKTQKVNFIQWNFIQANDMDGTPLILGWLIAYCNIL